MCKYILKGQGAGYAEPEARNWTRACCMEFVFCKKRNENVFDMSRLRKIIILVLLGLGILFQVGLALGMPWGFLAWGGYYQAELPEKMRVASVIGAIVLVLYFCVAYVHFGFSRVLMKSPMTKYVLSFIAVQMFINFVLNLMSQSYWEKVVMGPIALIISLIIFIELKVSEN